MRQSLKLCKATRADPPWGWKINLGKKQVELVWCAKENREGALVQPEPVWGVRVCQPRAKKHKLVEQRSAEVRCSGGLLPGG